MKTPRAYASRIAARAKLVLVRPPSAASTTRIPLSAAYVTPSANWLVSVTNVSQTRIGTIWQRGQTPVPPAPSFVSCPASWARPVPWLEAEL